MNGDTTAELTRRIPRIQPTRTTPQRRGKIWEWAEQLENVLSWWNDYTPAAAAIGTFIILIAVSSPR